jgi:hypothetical protein
MSKKPTLYEILGIPRNADIATIAHASQAQLDVLAQGTSGLDAAQLATRQQMIRIAVSTLKDPSSRLTYDARLAQEDSLSNPETATHTFSSATAASITDALVLRPTTSAAPGHDSAHLRAEALSLKAEALSLKADAMILQASAGANSLVASRPGTHSAAAGWLEGIAAGRMWRVLIFMLILLVIAMSFSRCAVHGPAQREASESKAGERAALQEYFQTYGVRPANMAEMELLQAERKRKDNEQRSQMQDLNKTKTDEQKFEEESRRRAEEVSDRLRRDEEAQKVLAERELERERQAERELRDRKDAERLAEQQRIKKLEEKWQTVITR